MKRILCFFSLLVIFILVFSLSGCWNPFKPDTKDKPGPPKEELLPRTTPQNVLNNARVMYSVMDNSLTTPEDAHALALKYRELLHPDFKFYFLASDVPPGFPEGWWGRNDEVADFDSLMTLRALGLVSEVQLSWTPGAAEPDNRIDSNPPYALLHPGWMWVHVTSVLFEVRQGDTVYRVPNGLIDFYFAPDPADSTLWVITEWWDRQPAG